MSADSSYVPEIPCKLRPQENPFYNLLPELQLMIIHYLDFWDKATLIESTLLTPKLVIGADYLDTFDEDGNALLHVAVKQNYEKATKSLLSAGIMASIQSQVPEDHAATPLILASEGGNLAIVKMLLESGASVHEWNYSGVYPLHYASQNGHTSIVHLLLKLGAKQENNYDFGTPLHLAASNGHADVIRALLSHDATLSPLRRGVTALWLAVASGHVYCVRILLETGAAKSEPRGSVWAWPLLHLAAGGPHASQAGEIACEPSIREISRFPVLIWKPGEKELWAEIVRLLIRPGVDVCEGLESVTPLHLAVVVGNYSAVEALINAGADIHARNEHGRSSLMFACLLGYDDIGRLLSKAKQEKPNEKKPVIGAKPKLTLR